MGPGEEIHEENTFGTPLRRSISGPSDYGYFSKAVWQNQLGPRLTLQESPTPRRRGRHSGGHATMIIGCIVSIISILGVGSQQVAITVQEGQTTFWYNSSDTRIATYTFDFCSVAKCDITNVGCLKVAGRDVCGDYGGYQLCKDTTQYICVTDDYWGDQCAYWGAVGWNTGEVKWNYRPESAMGKKDRHGKALLDRMTLHKHACNLQGNKLTLTIENPTAGDSGTYILATYGGTRTNPLTPFHIRDMYNDPEWKTLSPPAQTHREAPETRTNPLAPKKQTHREVVAIADPTIEETMTVETGFHDRNLWLEWMRYAAHQHNRSDCYVCSSARPHLGTVPLQIPENIQSCFLSLYTNITTNSTDCETWKHMYPLLTTVPTLGEGITVYPGNYTCFTNFEGNGRFLGNFTSGYCSTYSKIPGERLQNQTVSLGEVYWVCGDMKIRTRIEGLWRGECALTKALMPMHIVPAHEFTPHTPVSNRKRREVNPGGSFDPHVYIDAIGVPRGVPDDFKARDQVAAGFESLIPIITVNKNVDWINYIYYNQQRFVNYTRDALQGLADQLSPTTTMTFQNRMALDMLLAEKGGVCKMIGETCCTYIPDNTGPNGKVTQAIKKLTDLSIELKKNSGISDPWDHYFSWMSGWQKLLAQVGVAVLVILVILALIICCVFPLLRKMLTKAADEATPAFLSADPEAVTDDQPHTPLQQLPAAIKHFQSLQDRAVCL